MEDLVKRVEKQFLLGYPLQKWRWEDTLAFMFRETDDSLLFQNKLLMRTVKHRLMERYPLKLSYRIKFLKTLIDKMEESNLEVSDEVYEEYCRLLGKSGSHELHCQDKHFRHFILGEKCISLQESTKIVSEGTTGLYAWQASMALAEWCLKHQETILKDKRILELGSGVGLTGLACLFGIASHPVKDQELVSEVAERAYPLQVVKDGFSIEPAGNSSPSSFTFSDCHPSVLSLLCGNVKLNIMHSSSSQLQNSTGGCPLLEIYCNSTQVRVVNLLWQDLELGSKDAIEMVGKVDVIIAADVVYDQALFKPLIGSLKTLATKNDEGKAPTVVLACTKRNPATLEEFMDCLTKSGLCASEEEPVQPQYFMYDPDPPVGVFLISTS